MLPHQHFAISGAFVFLGAFVLFPEMSLFEIGIWVTIGGLVSAAIDIDITALVFLKSRGDSRLRPFKNPLLIYQEFERFMDAIDETGVLKIGLKTHFIFSTLIVLCFYVFSNEYFPPAALGAASHILSDVPNVKRAIK